MDVSRLVALLAGGAAGDISQNQGEQSALPTLRVGRQKQAIQTKRLHSDQDSNPEEGIVSASKGLITGCENRR